MINHWTCRIADRLFAAMAERWQAEHALLQESCSNKQQRADDKLDLALRMLRPRIHVMEADVIDVSVVGWCSVV